MCIRMSFIASSLWVVFASVNHFFVIFLVEELVRLLVQLMDPLSCLTKCSLISSLEERCLTFKHTACIEIAAANGKGS